MGRFAIAETTFKPAPGNLLGVEQVTDIFAAQADLIRTSAVIVERVCVADESSLNYVAGVVAQGGDHTMGLPEIRLTAPGDEGPNVVLNELSLMAKCCA